MVDASRKTYRAEQSFLRNSYELVSQKKNPDEPNCRGDEVGSGDLKFPLASRDGEEILGVSFWYLAQGGSFVTSRIEPGFGSPLVLAIYLVESV